MSASSIASVLFGDGKRYVQSHFPITRLPLTHRLQDKKKKSKNAKGTKDQAEATTSTPKTPNGSGLKQRDLTPRVEEVEDD